uniref:Uncharacterized protein n=1 Tax=Petromyzon marinus TaxID=7757 RepID=S4RW83_PETMA
MQPAVVKKIECDNFLSINKDSTSLDRCIQATLSALYPPFEATAATVLEQVFSLVEEAYQGDGLRYLLEFLVPGKHLLQTVQQDSCSCFPGRLFRHEGWPLCMGEKIILQLAPLDPRLLKPRDFYLLLTPASKAVGIVVRCLDEWDRRCVQEIAVPQEDYARVFSDGWLASLNARRVGTPLENCVLASEGGPVRLAWPKVAQPQFVDCVKDSGIECRANYKSESLASSASDCSKSSATTSIAACTMKSDSSSVKATAWRGPPRVDTHGRSSLTRHCGAAGKNAENGGSRAGGRLVVFREEPPKRSCEWKRDSALFERRRFYRKSYIEALQNPMDISSASDDSSVADSGTMSPQRCAPPACVVHLCRRGWCLRVAEDRLPSQLGKPGENVQKALHSRAGKAFKIRLDKKRLVKRAMEMPPAQGRRSRGSPRYVCGGYNLRLLFLKVVFTAVFPILNSSTYKEPFGMAGDKGGARPRGSPEREAASPAPGCPTEWQQVSLELLKSGVAYLTGNCGASFTMAIEVLYVWTNVNCADIFRLSVSVQWYQPVRRGAVREMGLTVVVDARKVHPLPALFKACTAMQETIANSLHSVLILVDREPSFKLEKSSVVQYDIVTSLKSLYKHIDPAQLPQEFEGTHPYCHEDWLTFRQKLEPFLSACRGAGVFLRSSIQTLTDSPPPKTAQEARDVAERHRKMMARVLEDSRLVVLQREGGAALARLKREDSPVTASPDYRDAMAAVTVLYSEVEELVHGLVMLSNQSLHRLGFLADFLALREETQEVRTH